MRARWAAFLLAAAWVGLGFVYPFGNPRAQPEKGLDALLQDRELPANAKSVLAAKCADCHSNQTRWPVYARVVPGAWLMERDVVKARQAMNLSNWPAAGDARDVLMAKIVEEARRGEMPPRQYLALHWGANLTATDVAALASMSKSSDAAAGSSQKNSSQENLSPENLSQHGDRARGKAVFQKRCTGCHAMEADREGPRLAGVYGRKAASVAGFNYSDGLRKSGITWNDLTLERWLRDPEGVAADTMMDFHVQKAQERWDLIAYFKQ